MALNYLSKGVCKGSLTNTACVINKFSVEDLQFLTFMNSMTFLELYNQQFS